MATANEPGLHIRHNGVEIVHGDDCISAKVCFLVSGVVGSRSVSSVFDATVFLDRDMTQAEVFDRAWLNVDTHVRRWWDHASLIRDLLDTAGLVYTPRGRMLVGSGEAIPCEAAAKP